jgi:hypothetical protein
LDLIFKKPKRGLKLAQNPDSNVCCWQYSIQQFQKNLVNQRVQQTTKNSIKTQTQSAKNASRAQDFCSVKPSA